MGDIKRSFRGYDLWDISIIILQGINWADIKDDSRVHKLWDISSIILGGIICGSVWEISSMALGRYFGRHFKHNCRGNKFGRYQA